MARILVVDDDRSARQMAVIGLEGHEVLQASNGQEAVEIAFRKRPDLILMDLMMPVMDGPTAAQILKQGRATAAIPIVAVTAYRLDDEFWSYFDHCLQKPYRLKELRELVAAYTLIAAA